MQDKPFEDDPRNTWQQQSPDEYKVALELLRLRARQLAVKVRIQFFSLVAVVSVLIAFDVWGFRTSSRSLQRAGFALAAAWTIYSLYKAGQSAWPGKLASDAGSLTCLAFSRNELQRRVNYLGNPWSSIALPIVFTLAVFLTPIVAQHPQQLVKGAPVLILLLIWLVMFIFIGKRERQNLRRELDVLNRLNTNEP